MCTLLAAGAGFARAQVAGTVDPSFSGGTTFNSDPQSVVVQDNGKIVIGGAFETIDGQARNRMARLLPNGVLEESLYFQSRQLIRYLFRAMPCRFARRKSPGGWVFYAVPAFA